MPFLLSYLEEKKPIQMFASNNQVIKINYYGQFLFSEISSINCLFVFFVNVAFQVFFISFNKM
jgi:hypothetical protein